MAESGTSGMVVDVPIGTPASGFPASVTAVTASTDSRICPHDWLVPLPQTRMCAPSKLHPLTAVCIEALHAAL